MAPFSIILKYALKIFQDRSGTFCLVGGILGLVVAVQGVVYARRGKGQPLAVTMALLAMAGGVGAFVYSLAIITHAGLPRLAPDAHSRALTELYIGTFQLTYIVGLALCPACLVLLFGTPVGGESQGLRAQIVGGLLLVLALAGPLLLAPLPSSAALTLYTLGVELAAGARLVTVLIRRPDSSEAVDGQRLCAAAFLLLVRQLDALHLLTQLVQGQAFADPAVYQYSVDSQERTMVQSISQLDNASISDFGRVALVSLLPLVVLYRRQGSRRTALLTPIATTAVLLHLGGTNPRRPEVIVAQEYVAHLPEWRRVPIICAEVGALPPGPSAPVACAAFLNTGTTP